MSKTTVAAKSSSINRATPLVLALVVALEVTGVYALSQGPSQPTLAAAFDGAPLLALEATPQPARRLRAASVEVHIVAQADIPNR